MTGSAIVFREEADRALNQILMQVTPQPKKASVDRIFDSVQQAYPNLQAPFIRFPKTPLLITGLVIWKRRRWLMERRESTSQLRAESSQSNKLS